MNVSAVGTALSLQAAARGSELSLHAVKTEIENQSEAAQLLVSQAVEQVKASNATGPVGGNLDITA